jgi:hypothetical protein
MQVNKEAISIAAFSLAKILAAELLRKRILDREELISAISREIDEQRKIGVPASEDAATLLTVYCDELPGDSPKTEALT